MSTPSMSTEYDAARDGAAVIVRDDRAIVRVFGRDPVKMIHGLVTNDVAGASADRAVYALLLTPKGKMLADLRVLRRDGDLLLDVPAAALDNVTTTLKKFVPPLFARFETADTLAELSVHGSSAAALLGEVLGAPLPEGMAEDDIVRRGVGDVRNGVGEGGDEEHAHGDGGDGAGAVGDDGSDGRVYAVRSLYAGIDGYDVIGAAATVAALRDRLAAVGARPMSHATLEVLRIEAGR
ncbi:MAG: YgfZ/GcvT domain-containing protein, partial [Longimicrobiales bacterium]